MTATTCRGNSLVLLRRLRLLTVFKSQVVESLMSNFARFLVLFLFLAVTLALPFALFGDAVESLFVGDGAVTMLRDIGALGWLAAVVLLIADLLLPIPTTAVFAALGIVYGPLLGGLIASIGSFLAGCIGYGLCRKFGQGVAVKLVGRESMASGERLFERTGGFLVAFSRWLPLLPEVVACLAGLARMRLQVFVVALLCGVIPVGFVFAAVGHSGADRPVLTLVLSAVAPVVLWLLSRPFLKRLST